MNETLNQYFTLGWCLILGQLIHLTAAADAKYLEYKAKGKAFNFKKDFLIPKQFKIAQAILCSVVALVMYSEWVGVYEKITAIQKTLFIIIGFSGSGLILRYLNKGQKLAEDHIDNIGTNNNNNTMKEFEYAMDYGPSAEVLIYEPTVSSDNQTPADFSVLTRGTDTPAKHEIVWDAEPTFTSVTILIPGKAPGIAGPVKRPRPASN